MILPFYKEIIYPSDQDLLEADLNQVYLWSRKWLLNLNLTKCDSIICISYKRSPPLAQYQFEGQPLCIKSSLHYLEIHINSHLTWNDHVRFITTKPFRILNLLRNSLYTCPLSVKAIVYTCIVRPLLEYHLLYDTCIQPVISSGKRYSHKDSKNQPNQTISLCPPLLYGYFMYV